MGMTDLNDTIVDAVTRARDERKPLYIRGGDSKRQLLGRDCQAEPLDMSAHRGIIDYQPGELVVTARAGTPLADIHELLAQHRQMLPFEPPLLGGRATLGGTLACNISGPGRPWYGSIRDMVLGVRLVNGEAQLLKFGGQVMKNVAGYDVSRLQAGALGTLGVISEVSLKVLPLPEHSTTLVYAMDATQALEVMNRRAREPRPLSGAFWLDGRLYLRISGAASAVEQTASDWGGERSQQAEDIWSQLREMSLPFFRGDEALWRLSLNSAAPTTTPPEATLIDWGGAQRWLSGDADFTRLQRSAATAGGHASLFRGGDRNGEVRQALEPVQQGLQQRLKKAFDPHGIFNPGRLYSWL
jgi:glycolate oxidase FAD binding subunit